MRKPPLIALTALAVGSCAFDWDAVDPRVSAATSGPQGPEPTSGSSSGTSGGGGASTSSSTTGGGQALWFDPAWRRRSAIEVGDVTDAPHTNFVVRVHFDDARIDLDASGDGLGLRFVADDHSTLLVHEIETWDDTHGEAWVRIPSLTPGLQFWVYYDNPEATGAAGVPFEDYAAVWHLSDLSDASGSSANAASDAAVPTEGRIGLASRQLLNQSTQLEVAPVPVVTNIFASGGTVSAWILATSPGGSGYGRIVDKAADLAGTDGWTLHLGASSPSGTTFGSVFERGHTLASAASGTELTLMGVGSWHHVALVYDDGDPLVTTFYVDGQAVASSPAEPLGAAMDDAMTPLTIGGTTSANGRAFDGRIDEVRLERVARPAGWIETDYRSGSDLLLSFGAEETCPPSVCPQGM